LGLERPLLREGLFVRAFSSFALVPALAWQGKRLIKRLIQPPTVELRKTVFMLFNFIHSLQRSEIPAQSLVANSY